VRVGAARRALRLSAWSRISMRLLGESRPSRAILGNTSCQIPPPTSFSAIVVTYQKKYSANYEEQDLLYPFGYTKHDIIHFTNMYTHHTQKEPGNICILFLHV